MLTRAISWTENTKNNRCSSKDFKISYQLQNIRDIITRDKGTRDILGATGHLNTYWTSQTKGEKEII